MLDFRTCVKTLGSIVKPIRGGLMVSVAIGLLRIGASLGFVWICKALVDIATGVSDGLLWPHIWIMFGIMLVQISSNIFASYWENYFSVKVQNDMRSRFFDHVMNSVWDGKDVFHSGDTVNRLEEDVKVVVNLVCVRFPGIVITVCQLVAASIFLMSLAANLVWILFVLMVFAVLGSKMFFKVIRKLTAGIRGLESDVQSLMQESLQFRMLMMTLGAVDKILSKLGSTQDKLLETNCKRLNLNAVARAFMSLGFFAGYAAAFLWGVFGIKGGTVTYGMMTAFLQLVSQVQRPIADLSGHIPAFIHALTSVERLEEINALPLEVTGQPITVQGAPCIVISNLCYSYPGSGETVIKDFSFDFKAGGLTAIMGPTGQGKSTLTRIILSLLRPTSGKVCLVPSEGLQAGSCIEASPATRCNFKYVPQGNSLLSGTIRENLKMASSSATEEDMKHALHLAAADFVMDLPEGLDTQCAEKGAGLSEGQAQRIAIARALLHSGGVLILDEATSAIDAETEEKLLSNLVSEYKGRKTIIFVTHREAVLAYSDAVVRL